MRGLLRDVVEIVLGMTGILIRRLTALRLASIGGTVGLYYLLLAPNPQLSWAIAFFVFATLGHYVFLFGMLANGKRGSWAQALIRKHGEAPGFARFEAWLAVVFCLNGLSTGYVCSVTGGLELVPRPLAITLGVVLFVLGFTVKVWATRVASLDTYYYRDMFLKRPVVELKVSGPYRVFSNPMYGVGHLHGYGLALLAGSLPGLLAVAVNQACIWVFYVMLEGPHVREIYRAPMPAPPAGDCLSPAGE